MANGNGIQSQPGFSIPQWATAAAAWMAVLVAIGVNLSSGYHDNTQELKKAIEDARHQVGSDQKDLQNSLSSWRAQVEETIRILSTDDAVSKGEIANLKAANTTITSQMSGLSGQIGSFSNQLQRISDQIQNYIQGTGLRRGGR